MLLELGVKFLHTLVHYFHSSKQSCCIMRFIMRLSCQYSEVTLQLNDFRFESLDVPTHTNVFGLRGGGGFFRAVSVRAGL